LESQTGEYLFSTLQKTKTHHTSWSKRKETQSGQVSESPEREKNAAKRESERERERVGGEECNRGNGWERNVISDGENGRT
jgi:hypothetical protein